MGELKTSIEGIASAATAGGGDVKTALAAQVAVVKTSAENLVATLTDLPAGSENDPEMAALKSSAEELKASVADLETSIQAVGAATNAVGTVTALAGVAAAATVSVTALTDTTTAITTAAQDGKGTLSQAIAANDSCTALKS